MSCNHEPPRARPNPTRSPARLGAVLAVLVTGILLLSSGPSAQLSPSHREGPLRASPLSTPLEPAARHSASPAFYAPPSSFVGPFNGTRFNASWDETGGVGGSTAWEVVDPSTHTVYGSNLVGGFVTAWSEMTGQLVRESPELLRTPGNSELAGLAIDPAHHHLWAAALEGAGGGTLTMLDETTLAPLLNVTFPITYHSLPEFLNYDPATFSLIARDAGRGNVTSFNATTLTLEDSWVCGPCQLWPQTFLAGQNLLLEPTGAQNLSVLNASTLLLVRNLTDPIPTFGSATADYDPASGLVWVANKSTASTPMAEFNLGTGAYVGPVGVGVLSAFDMVYDPHSNVFAVDGHSSTPLSVTTYDATTGSVVGHYSRLDLSLPSEAFMLALDPGTDSLVVGSIEASVAVVLSLPTLSLAGSGPEFPIEGTTSASDPAAGMYYSLGIAPAVLTARHWSNGSIAWTTDLPSAFRVSLFGVAADSGLDRLYVSNTSLPGFEVLNASTGARVGAIPFPATFSFAYVSVDSVHHWLYALNGSGNVTVVSTQTDIPIGTVTAPLGATCGGAAVADSITESVYVQNCTSATGTIYSVNGSSATLGPRQWHIGGNVNGGLALDPVRQMLYVGGGVPYNVTVIPVRTLGLQSSFLTGGEAPGYLAVDPNAGLVVLSNLSSPRAYLFSTATQTLVGTVPAGVSLGALANPTDGEFVINQALDGSNVLLRPLALPQAPTGLALLAQNSSLTASWSAVGAAGAGNATITGYTASLGSSATGPWTTNLSVSQPNATFTHLTDGSTYFVTVTSHTVVGTSPPASPASAVPVGVPYPPTSVAATSTGSSSLRVSWNVPSSTDGAPVRNYTVEFATSAAGPWTALSAGTALNASLPGLKGSTSYTVFVTASNSAGTSNASARATATTSAPASRSSSPLGGSLLWVVLALVAVVAVVAAVLLLRRRPKGPPPSAPAPTTVSSGPAAGYGNVPPGVGGGPPSAPPPGA
ncbi:MAG: fibronectin type III domain-containing protein [Thermoplasmata archaeon]|nr:fibronectin type III domain-containing protein [Thermoplasmata archaeon]